ncbi:MAG TPA: helix-turn-helix domain-containing protein [Ktedonobacterales bacterium]|nr:helix-turn-helix domain-containing protein [Ktedonobacterales bacterium]
MKQQAMGEQAVLTVMEAAALLRIGRRQAYERVRSGELPAIRCGTSWRVPRAELERYMRRTTRNEAS